MAYAMTTIIRLFRRDDAQDLLEYGLLMALVAIGALLAVTSVGDVMNTIWWGPIAHAF